MKTSGFLLLSVAGSLALQLHWVGPSCYGMQSRTCNMPNFIVHLTNVGVLIVMGILQTVVVYFAAVDGPQLSRCWYSTFRSF